MTKLQAQYEGYSKTPLLWCGNLFGLQQLDFHTIGNLSFKGTIPKGIRLGHLVEHFVHFDLINEPEVELLANNVQINDSRSTLGEIDFVIQKNNQLIHIETSYKFYLWDDSKEHAGIRKWIGPNRKDALYLKLEKIKNSQFPLIKNEYTHTKLEALGVPDSNIQQFVHFKGQLFVPMRKSYKLEGLNPDCIVGFYMRTSDLDSFVTDKFHIPSKYDWLTHPHVNVDWNGIDWLKENVVEALRHEQSVLLWKKTVEGNLSKFFLVWWN